MPGGSCSRYTERSAEKMPRPLAGVFDTCKEPAQFFSACMGAGMRPPRWIITAGLNLLMGMMGA